LYFSLRGTEWVAKYEVIAQDSDSIVLRIHSDDLWKRAADPFTADLLKQMAEPRLQQTHFRRLRGRQYYWISCGTFCECFRRLDSKASRGRP
jgi:hypothetical protein